LVIRDQTFFPSSFVIRHSALDILSVIRHSSLLIAQGVSMVRLVHLSDIHITDPNLQWARADWFNKRLAAWVNFRWLGRGRSFRHANHVLTRLVTDIEERRVDHVIFSGDATALGFEAEFRKAAEILRVQALPGLAVPGNHDYCTVPAAAAGYFERSFAPWLVGRRIHSETYPFAQRVGSVWLVAVNTATGNRLAWDAGGAAGPAQRSRLAKLLADLDPGPRLLVTHFPLCLANGKPEKRVRGLRDLDELVAVAAQGGVSLWLHGHRHGFYYFQKPPCAPFPVICAGSATQTGLWGYCEYTLAQSHIQVLRRVYNPLAEAFEDADRIALQLNG
jgi:3',5'-cyclic AMP phosphodiesterase CpdA